MRTTVWNIDEIIKLELNRVFSDKDPYLKNGAAGITVFLIWLYNRTKEEKYRIRALEVIDNIGALISANPPLEIFNGVAGIGILLIWLHDQGLLDGDIDDILESIDNYIYRKSCDILDSYNNRYDYTVLDILLYIFIRLKSSKDICLVKIYERLWLKLYNSLSSHISLDFFIEKDPPELKSKLIMFLLICYKGSIINQDIKTKVNMTLRDLRNHCLSFFPRLSFNRLLMYIVVKNINETIHLGEEWNTYERLLASSLEESVQLGDQMKPNDMFLTHGIPCLIMLMKHVGIPISNELKKKLLTKITESDFYNLNYAEMKKFGYVGLDGIFGTIMAVTELKS